MYNVHENCLVIQASAELLNSLVHQHTVDKTYDNYAHYHSERRCETSQASNVIYIHHTLDAMTSKQIEQFQFLIINQHKQYGNRSENS